MCASSRRDPVKSSQLVLLAAIALFLWDRQRRVVDPASSPMLSAAGPLTTVTPSFATPSVSPVFNAQPTGSVTIQAFGPGQQAITLPGPFAGLARGVGPGMLATDTEIAGSGINVRTPIEIFGPSAGAPGFFDVLILGPSPMYPVGSRQSINNLQLGSFYG